MKVKISRNKSGETLVDYLNVEERQSFRFRLLQKVLDRLNNNAMLLVDTNQRVAQQTAQEILDSLRQAGIDPLAIKIPANPQTFFGFPMKSWNKKAVEYILAVDLAEQPLTEQIFKPLSGCDIALGIHQTEPLTNQLGMVGTNPLLLLDTCFDNKLYDSILCTRIKSNLDISEYVKEVIHEMGL
jgi:hypothetical protein